MLLVYLASQTLIRGVTSGKKATYSELIRQVEDGNVNQVLFTPNKRQINATLVSGQKMDTATTTSRSTRSSRSSRRRT